MKMSLMSLFFRRFQQIKFKMISKKRITSRHITAQITTTLIRARIIAVGSQTENNGKRLLGMQINKRKWLRRKHFKNKSKK